MVRSAIKTFRQAMLLNSILQRTWMKEFKIENTKRNIPFDHYTEQRLVEMRFSLCIIINALFNHPRDTFDLKFTCVLI